jgi:hypothetical protein
LPAGQLNKVYWLPWYTNNQQLNTQLRIANVSGVEAHVNIFIGGVKKIGSPFTIPVNGNLLKNFAGIDKGPVKIVSDQKILASQRVIYTVNGVATSFSEMIGLSASQVDKVFWLPWYNNKTVSTELRIANASNLNANVQVTIGGVDMGSFPLAARTSIRKTFTGIDKGPVRIESDQNIVVAERVIYRVNGTPTSYSETMGLPNKQLNMTVWLPWYTNNQQLNTQLRIANVSGMEAHVRVFISGVQVTGSPFTIPVNGNLRKNFAGIDKGPVKIVSDQKIVASERVIYTVNGVATSFSEMLALPNSLKSMILWFPWYNNVGMNTQLRLAVP